ncbi:MAG: hypothetical protein IT179_07070 [Acidobacteria bacterium]|nr:hypothetical protein [Acidobacteriota bacterium]
MRSAPVAARQSTPEPSRCGAAISPALLRKHWAAACTAAGYPGRIPHDFRRTAVRNLVRAGVPEAVAMRLTGHKARTAGKVRQFKRAEAAK